MRFPRCFLKYLRTSSVISNILTRSGEMRRTSPGTSSKKNAASLPKRLSVAALTGVAWCGGEVACFKRKMFSIHKATMGTEARPQGPPVDRGFLSLGIDG